VTLTTPSGEVVIVPLTEDAAGRFTSYELLAKAYDLAPAAQAAE